MATLYLTEQGSKLVKDHRRLTVEKDGEVIFEVPAFKVDLVLIFGNVAITTPAMSFLLENGIDTAFLSIHGRLKGRLVPLESKNVILRMRQFERAKDQAFTLRLAKQILEGKLKNAKRVIQRYSRNHPEEGDFTAAFNELDRLISTIPRKETLNALMGLEGQASAAYFQAYGKMFRTDMAFTTRSRRPPRDPPNALLSLGYTLLVNEAVGVLSGVGFDPYVGFYHGIHYGRPSLALDLLEEFRHAIVDRLVLTLLNKQILQMKDFQATIEEGAGEGDQEAGPPQGVFLTAEGRKTFFTHYEERMQGVFSHPRTGERVTFRKLLFQQAQTLAKAVMEEMAYEPFVIE
ncbi:MAG: CRISPR-associated endonuclease Cas1 [Candidatus Methylomirabilales bacterium]